MLLASLLVLTVLAADESSSASEPARLPLATAQEKLAAYIRAQKPGVVLNAEFVVTELTTAAIWKQLGVQIIQVKGGAVALHEAYVLRGDSILPIGRAIGGDGVTSVLVADLVGGKHALVYAFAWGSGEHRSEIGVLDLAAEEPKELRLLPINWSHTDYRLRLAESGDVEVLVGKTLVGHVAAKMNDGKLNASIKLIDGLPAVIRQQLK